MDIPETAAATLAASEIDALARCVDLIGLPEFPEALCHLCCALCDADTVLLTAFFEESKPAQLYSNHSGETDEEALRLYLDVAYLLDPFYALFRQRPGDRIAMLGEIAPDDFRNSEYFLKFFKAFQLEEECGLLLEIGASGALFFSFGARAAGAELVPERLRTALPLVAALARRHWTVLSPESPDGSGRMAAHLEASFEAFGTSVLSPRESEILKMILKGHSSKAIARVFENSPETIKVHRKRIYTKLDVASQGELLSIFLAALSRMPATASGDPLQFLPGISGS